MDADALNLLAKLKLSSNLPKLILTPHPGEAARLLNTSVAVIESDRFSAAAKIQTKFNANCNEGFWNYYLSQKWWKAKMGNSTLVTQEWQVVEWVMF